MIVRPTPRHVDLLGVTSDQHHAKIHANSHVSGGADTIIIGSSPIDLHHNEHLSGGADTIIIGSSPIDLHHNEHLSGGADSLPWGAGGGLDCDSVDGKSANQLMRILDDINYATEHNTLSTTFVTVGTFSAIGLCTGVYVSVDLYADSGGTAYAQLTDMDGNVLLSTSTTSTSYVTLDNTYQYGRVFSPGSFSLAIKTSNISYHAWESNLIVQFLQ